MGKAGINLLVPTLNAMFTVHSSFNVWKRMFKFVWCSTKWFLTHHYNTGYYTSKIHEYYFSTINQWKLFFFIETHNCCYSCQIIFEKNEIQFYSRYWLLSSQLLTLHFSQWIERNVIKMQMPTHFWREQY